MYVYLQSLKLKKKKNYGQLTNSVIWYLTPKFIFKFMGQSLLFVVIQTKPNNYTGKVYKEKLISESEKITTNAPLQENQDFGN